MNKFLDYCGVCEYTEKSREENVHSLNRAGPSEGAKAILHYRAPNSKIWEQIRFKTLHGARLAAHLIKEGTAYATEIPREQVCGANCHHSA